MAHLCPNISLPTDIINALKNTHTHTHTHTHTNTLRFIMAIFTGEPGLKNVAINI